MPYTDAWSNSSPPGSTAANQIDDEFRKLRLQIAERMAVLVVDWLTDPVVPLASSGPKTVVIPHSAFVSSANSGAGALYEDGRAGSTFSTGRLRTGISNIVPHGATVTLIEWLVDKGTSAGIDCKFDSTEFSVANGYQVENLISTAVAGLQLLVTAPLTTVINPDRSYSLSVFPTAIGTFYVHGVRITYTL